MKYGVVFPQTEIGNDPAHIKDFAQAVEDLGYDHLVTYEHVLGINPDRPGWRGWRPYTYEHAFHEPFTLFAYLAALTERITLGTAILVLPQRQTPLVAKQAAEIDILSGGRLRLGVGVGWNDFEFASMGADFHTRGRRIEEQVRLLRELWTKPLVTFQGTFETVDDAGINPLPLQRPIPLWMGGGAETVLRRMARLADGWFIPSTSLSETKTHIERIHRYLAAEGRQPEDFGLDVRITLKKEDDWGNWVTARREAGATHISANPRGMEDPIDAIRRFKDGI